MNKKEIKCPKCGSTQIKEVEGVDDFLPYKNPEVLEKDVKKLKIKTKQKLVCLEEECRHEWEEDLL